MWNSVISIIVLHMVYTDIEALWDTETTCPLVCTCRLEHLKETAIHRFVQKHLDDWVLTQADNHIHNEVLYEDNVEFMEENPFLRAVTCILQTETEPHQLLEKLPKDTETLTLIQGARSGNKTLIFSNLKILPQLTVLELHGTNINESNASIFFCEIDTPLHNLKFLNLDKIFLNITKKDLIKNKPIKEVIVFENIHQLNSYLKPLIIEKRLPNEILSYNKYIHHNISNEIPSFLGFESLFLLRISSCQINSVNWEMFDGLQNLEYLILEKNNLTFIPDFTFYGTPNLKSLSLAWNNLLNIQIADLAGLLELEYLDLSHNNFSQLSELSFPPFPKLKLANFADNPISIVFPSTFEVMNTTESLLLGDEVTPLTLISNSFLGLKRLKKLTLKNLIIPLLKRELLVGMPNLNELIMSGNISQFEYDAFLDVFKLEKLIVANCKLQNISMDAFIGLEILNILDLSGNNLEYIHPGTFDPLKNLKELYLNKNKLTFLPIEIFSNIHPKLIRLDENPWHCSCAMSNWKPMIVNKIKQKSVKNCEFLHDKGIGCPTHKIFYTKYIFDSRVAPKCATPKSLRIGISFMLCENN